MKKIGFVGVGNMGYPIFKAALTLCGKDEVWFYDKSEASRMRTQEQTGVAPAESNAALISGCEYVLLAVKPQFAEEVLAELIPFIRTDTKIISIMAGVSIDRLVDMIGRTIPIIRLMPNTPAMVGEGMTAMCCGEGVSEEMHAFVQKLCESFGRVALVPEKLMNAAICANGSSPAYVYMFIEALADSVVRYGIPRDMAYTLVAQTVFGSAKMVLETGVHPGALKDAVCSPGGTTIAAVAALEEHGLRNALIKATDACYAKGNELAGK